MEGTPSAGISPPSAGTSPFLSNVSGTATAAAEDDDDDADDGNNDDDDDAPDPPAQHDSKASAGVSLQRGDAQRLNFHQKGLSGEM